MVEYSRHRLTQQKERYMVNRTVKCGWTVLHVVRNHGKKSFRHGHLHIAEFDPNYLRLSTAIQVFRNGTMIDAGKTVEMGGHDGSVRIEGLMKCVPSNVRLYRSLGHPGYVPTLDAKHFKPGDVVRVHVFASSFQRWIRFSRSMTRIRKAPIAH